MHDLTGRTYGSAHVLWRADPPTNATGRSLWRVRCLACGHEYDAAANLIVRGPAACRECRNRRQPIDQAGRLSRKIWRKKCAACGWPFTGTAAAKYCPAARCQTLRVIPVALRLSEIDSLRRHTAGRKTTAAGIIRRLLREAGYIGHHD